MSAPNIGLAPLPHRARRFWGTRFGGLRESVEAFLERERGQLPPWFVVGFGCGIAAWFALDQPLHWAAFLCWTAALAVVGFSVKGGRAERAAGWFGLAMMLGCALVWARSHYVAASRMERPRVAEFRATVERVETRTARGDLRLTLAPADPALPPRIRVSTKLKGAPEGIAAGAELQLRARLTPPPQMTLPGGYDSGRDFWFRGIGAAGRSLGPVTVVRPTGSGGIDVIRERLGRHIRKNLPGPNGGIATALVTGDQNAVLEPDAEAMRRSGLTHLLSVSGLHISAVVGAAMLLTIKLLALSERVALRVNLILVAAAVAAVAGIAYTFLAGAQVPTVRSCVAALLVLAGIALGRDALSMRLVAVGALLVLVFRPEAITGASFQLSFAAVAAIIALHSSGWARRMFHRRDEAWIAKLGRALLALAATGLAVEIALIPIVLYHFHKAGLYGVAANIVAIPLSTFIIMPLEAGALLLDVVGIGAPLWWLAGLSLDALLGIAHLVADSRGAIAMLAAMPPPALGMMVAGGLWLCLWTTRPRMLGLAPILAGAAAAAMAPTPDLLVTGDGRHLAVVDSDGTPLLLRERSGPFIRGIVADFSGFDDDPQALAARPFVSCSRDSCIALIDRGGRRWQVLATRSTQSIEWRSLVRACAESDIVVSDRWLPRACTPRWLKLDRDSLGRTGAVAIYLAPQPSVTTVAERIGGHPWAADVPKRMRYGPRPSAARRSASAPIRN
ncbi:MAG TPA: ComEC/Rec2 family competence protein [Sphingomicrobium sp.]|nr:ComEC/Rec2 family competence protein [Sphingomicrobium sp.]